MFVVVVKTLNSVSELKQNNETVYFETFEIAQAEADRLAHTNNKTPFAVAKCYYWVEAA